MNPSQSFYTNGFVSGNLTGRYSGASAQPISARGVSYAPTTTSYSGVGVPVSTSYAGAAPRTATYGTASFSGTVSRPATVLGGGAYVGPAAPISTASFAPASYSAPTSGGLSAYAPAGITSAAYAPAGITSARGTSQLLQGFSSLGGSLQAGTPLQTLGRPVTVIGGSISGSFQPASFQTSAAVPVSGTYIRAGQTSADLLRAGNVVGERVIPREEIAQAPAIRLEVMQPTTVFEEVAASQVGQVVEHFEEGAAQVVDHDHFEQLKQVPQEAREMQAPVEQGQEQQPLAPRVLIVCTSANALGDMPTGAWSEEITAPYYVFRDAGCEVHICSINGGPVPLDQNSLAEGAITELDRRFLEEGGEQLLNETFALSQYPIEDIDCVWLAGGHGTCMDFEAALAQYITDAVAYGRPVGAVCHGVIGLLSAINQDSTPLLTGRDVTGFSNAEEAQLGLSSVVPFLVEDRMLELGAKYSCAEPWQEYALSDGQLTTGQNPQSSLLAAQLCVQAMMPQQDPQ